LDVGPGRTVASGALRQVSRDTIRRVGEPIYTCPCCGYLVFEEEPGSYDICPVCGWEDDLSQLRFPTTGGANRPLIERQAAYFASRSRSGRDMGFVRDLDWRPLDPGTDDIDEPQPGVDYGPSYDPDLTTYYYWLRTAQPPPGPH
jgi:hypothetical protein